MGKRIIGVVCGLILVSYTVQGQGLKFKNDFYDFGKLEKSSPNVSHDFKFRNVSDKPVSIKKVKTSCGCTSPDWPKKPIKPDETGKIKVVFSPSSQKGYFQKEITVLTKSNKVYHLMIEGIVRDKEKVKARARKILPFNVGNLQMDKKRLDFGDVRNETRDTAFLTLYNESEKNIKLKKVKGAKAIHFPALPLTFRPGEKRTIKAIYEPIGMNSAYKNYGTKKIKFAFVTTDTKKPNKRFSAQARLYPNIEKPEDGAKRPRLRLEKRVINLGQVSSGFYLKSDITLTNIGTKPLKIYGTDAQMCSCTEPITRKKILKPGESTDIRVDFNAKNFNGRVREAIKVYTNDPDRPNATILIKAHVET